MKAKFLCIFFFCLMLSTLIFDPSCGIQAAYSGLEQCIKSVIPSVLPFLFLSNSIAGTLREVKIRWLETVLKIPTGYGGYFLLSQLCGYPVGAMLLQQEVDAKRIDRSDASRMCFFCNNASPGFIIGILSSIFSVYSALIMWIIQITTSFLLGAFIPGKANSAESNHQSQERIGVIIKNSVSGMANICVWVILFRVLLAYINKFTPLSGITGTIITGTIELTNGLYALSTLQPKCIAFTLCAFLLSFGGICVIMQTKSIASIVKMKSYILFRLLHGLVSSTLAYIVSRNMFEDGADYVNCIPLFLCALAICVAFFYFNKKSGSIPADTIV